MAIRIRWYLVTLEPHIDPVRSPVPTVRPSYGRTSVIGLTATEGLMRVVADDTDHVVIEAAPGTVRLRLLATVGGLPIAARLRLRAHVTALNSELLAVIITRLGRVRQPLFDRVRFKSFIQPDEPAVGED